MAGLLIQPLLPNLTPKSGNSFAQGWEGHYELSWVSSGAFKMQLSTAICNYCQEWVASQQLAGLNGCVQLSCAPSQPRVLSWTYIPWGLSSYTMLCRGVGQASNRLGLVPSVITNLCKPCEVQKPPGERYSERKSNPSLGCGFRPYGGLNLTRSNQPHGKRNAVSVCPLASFCLKC